MKHVHKDTISQGILYFLHVIYIYRRAGGKRSYFQKAPKMELFEMSAVEGAISNEPPKKELFW